MKERLWLSSINVNLAIPYFKMEEFRTKKLAKPKGACYIPLELPPPGAIAMSGQPRV